MMMVGRIFCWGLVWCLGLSFSAGALTTRYDDFADLAAFKLNGQAAQINPASSDGRPVLRLVETTRMQAGSAFLRNPVEFGRSGSFETSFAFRISEPSGLGNGADGFAFVIQSRGPEALGEAGSYLGYRGIQPSVAVEFDIYDSTGECGFDSNNDNHVAININGNLTSVAQYNLSPSLKNGRIWYAWIHYNADSSLLEVRVAPTSSRPAKPQLAYPMDLFSILGKRKAYVGFTAATGNGVANHDLLAWEFRTE
jgi:hypothetical protein